MNKHFRLNGQMRIKLEEKGVSAADVLRHAGLPPGLFDEPRLLVTTDELFALWHAVGEVSSDPAIGLALGMEAKTEKLTPSALAALSTENLGAGVRQIARFKRLTCPEEILEEREAGEWSIQFRWTLSSGAEPRALIDCCFAWLQTIARHGTGTHLSPLRLEYMQQRSYGRVIERHFSCPVEFGATRNAIVYRAEDAARKFVTRNAELLAMLAPQLEEELRQQQDSEDFSETVCREIQQQLTGRRPIIEDVARAMRISSRTLQRRLQESGSSFQRVLEKARRQLARHYLNNSVLELNEAAYLLGYEDSNSFVRAFRTWEGIPPARWREQQRGKVAS